MEATIHKEVLSYPTKLLLVEMIKKFKQEDKKDEIIDVVLAVANDIKTNDSITAKAIKDEVEEKFKNELATKEFVGLKVAEVRTEIAEVRTEIAKVDKRFDLLEQKFKFYAIGLGALIILFQPKVFDFITSFFK